MEHLHHFDLVQDPFQNEPDLRFFFPSETHRRAQLRVDRALRQSKGLVVLVGEGGTGKSLLARSMFEELEEEMFESSLLVMMQGTADAVSVLRRFCAQLGLEETPSERPALLNALYEQLAIVREDGRHTVLIIDDAHVLGRDAMAEIVGLLNLEYEDRRLLSLLLVGMPELDEMIGAMPSVAERVDVRVQLEPMTEGEATAYLEHRVRSAGCKGDVFESSATKAIYTLGGGRPRRMNTLADNALFEAFLAGRKQVGEDDVRRAGSDLSYADPVNSIAPTPQPATASASAPAPAPAAAAGAAAALDMPAEPEPFAAPTELAIDSFDALEGSFEAAPLQPPTAASAPLPAADPVSPAPDPALSHSGMALPEPEGIDPVFHEPQQAGEPGPGQPQSTVLMDVPGVDAAESTSGDLDLASLLGDDGPTAAPPAGIADAGETMDELQLDSPIQLEDPAEDSFPSFTAENSAQPMVEATRLALPDEDPFASSQAPIPTETTDSDEIDDLFVELLED